MAPTLLTLIISRAIAGMGGGGILTCSSIIMSDLVSLRERGRYQGIGNAVFGTASMIGAPLGGFLADQLSWRWAFWVNLPVGVLPVVLILCLLEDYNVKRSKQAQSEEGGEVVGEVEKTSLWVRLKRIDIYGSLGLIFGMTSLAGALSVGGNAVEGGDWRVWSGLGVGVVGLVGFVCIEKWVASEPIMPISILMKQTPAACYWVNLCSSMAALSSVFLVPLWFQVLLGQSATQSGAYLIPKICSSSIGSITAGIYMEKTASYQSFTRLCLFMMFVSEVLMVVRWGPATEQWEYLLYLSVDGFSFGAILTTVLIAMLAAVSREDLAVSSAMSYLFRSTGSVLGIAISQATLQSVLKTTLESSFTDPELYWIIDLARKSVSNLRNGQIPEVYLKVVVDAYLAALRAGFAVCAGFSLLSLLGGLGIQRLELGGRGGGAGAAARGGAGQGGQGEQAGGENENRNVSGGAR
ncbi:hypothetical protein HDU76_008042, partial [Blyttiomyces sp. JEL0837]